MSTLLTDSNNDLYLDAKNNITISTSRIQEIQQLVTNKLQTFLGEVYLDTNEGVDYFNIILEKLVPLEIKLDEIRTKILEVNGVIGIENIDYSLTNNNSEANFDITIQTDSGTFLLSDLPLIV
jgi:hypothetical protein